MRSVNRFEYNLLRILSALVGQLNAQMVNGLLVTEIPQPHCLSRTCIELAKELIAKGTVQLLAQLDGWREKRFLRGQTQRTGLLWERSRPQDLGLKFSPYSLRLLISLTANDIRSVRQLAKSRLGRKMISLWPQPITETNDFTSGDWWLLFLAFNVVYEVNGLHLETHAVISSHGLYNLYRPRYRRIDDPIQPNFEPWVTLTGSAILECYQATLAQQWIAIEQSKQRLTNPTDMLVLGNAQRIILNSFLDAVEKAERRDLATFLLVVAQEVLHPQANVANWIGNLKVRSLRLADREQAYNASMAFVSVLERLQSWSQSAQGIGYFDEGYAASQLWKSTWEAYNGDELASRAQELCQLASAFK